MSPNLASLAKAASVLQMFKATLREEEFFFLSLMVPWEKNVMWNKLFPTRSCHNQVTRVGWSGQAIEHRECSRLHGSFHAHKAGKLVESQWDTLKKKESSTWIWDRARHHLWATIKTREVRWRVTTLSSARGPHIISRDDPTWIICL